MPRGRPRSGGSSSLEARIQEFATQFAREVIGALRSAPLSDIAALSGASLGLTSGTAAGVPGPSVRPKRKMTNYPKCKWGSCGKNMSPRTRPYCGEHFRRVRAGENPPGGVPEGAAAAPARKPGRPKGKKK